MPKILIPLAQGFEELEAITIIDILRRAGADVVLVGLAGGPVESARKVKIITDTIIDSVRSDDYDMIVLPGGADGAVNLNMDDRVNRLLKEFFSKGKFVAAMCAAPFVLANAGILEGRTATCYPSYRQQLTGATYSTDPVVVDGKVITSRGPATAPLFALTLVEHLVGKDVADEIRKAMLYDELG